MNKWPDIILALAIAGFAVCVLMLITTFWDRGAGFLHLHATEIVLGAILAVGALVWLTRCKGAK